MFQWQQIFAAPVIIICIFVDYCNASLKLSKCKKALFDHKNGTFYSVGFPKPIVPPQCFIYHFEASLEYLVELELETAEIPSSIGDSCVDFLRIYDKEKDTTIDEGSINYRELCGKSSLLENRNFISAFNHLFLVINVETSHSVRIKGSYRFLPKSDYYIDAIKTAPDICEYEVNALKGQLVSPQYPYFSPSNTSCTYHFPAFRGHRLHLNITDLDLSKRTCSEAHLSLYKLNPRHLLERLCSSIDIPYAFSSAQEILLEFRTSLQKIWHFGLQRQTRGFQLLFEYIPIKLLHSPSSNNKSSSATSLTAVETPSQLWSLILQKQGGSVDGQQQQQQQVVSQCPVRIISSRASFPIYEESMTPSSNNSGILSSEHFVPSEKINFKCQFVFIGAPEEHVQLTFHKFQLFAWKDKGVNSTSELRCEEMDHVSAHVLVGSRMSKIYDFCGSEIPPPLMSAKNILTLDYIVKSIGNGRHVDVEDDYGFVIEYRFLPDWGKQPPEVRKDPTKPCAYVFNGTTQTSGQFWSPNHPGFYPRNLDCEYVFFGRDTQIVVIHFEYFDIEGFGQCEDATHSDYVLFSNYKTIDRTNRRYCGSLKPNGDIASESNYFRMAFRTNDIFDGTGFYAQYQFIDQLCLLAPWYSEIPMNARNELDWHLKSVIELTIDKVWIMSDQNNLGANAGISLYDRIIKRTGDYNEYACKISFKNVYQQTFDFPYDVIKHILANASYNVVKKLYFTCKYFPSKCRLYLIDGLQGDSTIFLKTSQKKHFGVILSKEKFWLGDEISAAHFNSTWTSKIEKCTIKKLFISSVDFQWNDFKILAKEGTIENLQILKVVHFDGGGGNIAIEDSLGFLSNVNSFELENTHVTLNSIKEICSLKRSTKIKTFYTKQTDGLVNAKDYLAFLQKNYCQHSHFHISFSAAHVPWNQGNELIKAIKVEVQKWSEPKPHFFDFFTVIVSCA